MQIQLYIAAAVSLLACCITGHAADPNISNDWSRIKAPIAAHPKAIGSYANGCQLGAQLLPESGYGYVSIRRYRNRYYTQPITLGVINHIANYMGSIYNARILIGDLSQPAGGKMPFGHTSHQNGLDVDFWFYTVPEGSFPPADIEPPTMVDKASGVLIPGRWQEAYTTAVMAAAEHPDTTRIFVNPVIKKHLCAQHYTIDATERLRKIRPWWGHDAHFHVRMRCPENSTECEPQTPPPPGSGCDAHLDQWIAEQSDAILHPKPAQPSKPKPPKRLHPHCAALLN